MGSKFLQFYSLSQLNEKSANSLFDKTKKEGRYKLQRMKKSSTKFAYNNMQTACERLDCNREFIYTQ